MPVGMQVRLVITHVECATKAEGNFCNPTDSSAGLTACRQRASMWVLALIREAAEFYLSSSRRPT